MTRSLALMPLLISIAGLSMGNQSCSTPPAPRHLKMSANVGTLSAQDFTLPSGQAVSFDNLANSLFSNQVYINDYFIQMNAVNQVISTVNGASAVSSAKSNSAFLKAAIKAAAPVSADPGVLSDAEMLLSYGFGKNAAPANLAHALLAEGDPGAAVPACLYQTAQATIGGSIVSFEQTGSGGVSIGYTTSGPITATASGAIQISSSQLDMVVNASNDLWGRQIASINAETTNTNVNFSLGFGLLGLDYIMKTPIATTVENDMAKALNDLVNDFITKSDNGTWASAWESRVIYAPGSVNNQSLFALGVGSQAYAKVGDTFTLTNMYTQWNGTPCQSTLADSTIANPALGQVTATIIAVGEYSSIAQIVGAPSGAGSILPGAQVKILTLATPTPTPSATPAPTPAAQ